MFVRLIFRLLEFLAMVWLVRFLVGSLLGGGGHTQAFNRFQTREQPRPNGPSPAEPRVISGEMKKDPQCGTYVSTELSLKSRQGNEVLHFCSRRCQEEFLQAHSGKRA
jgi:YHS domain-containing protein